MIAVGDVERVGAHEHDVGGLDRDVGAGADRDADVGLRERGRVVDAVADHRHLAALAPGARRPWPPCRPGGPRRCTSSMPSSAAIRSAVARLSPVSMTGRMPSSLQRRDGGARRSRAARRRSRSARPRARRRATWTTVRPSPASSSARAGEPVELDALALEQARVADASRRPSTVASAPWPGHGLEALGRGGVEAARLGGARRSPRRAGARSRARPRRRGAARSSSSMPSAVAIATTSGSPRVSVPVLSNTTVSSVGRLLERDRVLEQDPALGAEAGADHDRRRRRQAERVRAGDHDDGDREQRARPATARPTTTVPDEERADAADERDEHEPERGPVGEPLRRRLRVLRLLDELDDLGERGVRADRGRAGPQRAVLVDRRADERRRRAASRPGRLSPVTIDSSTSLSPSIDLGVDRDLRARAGSAAGRRPRTSAVGTSTGSPSRSTTAFGGARSRARGSRRSRRRGPASRTSARAARTRRGTRPPRRRPRPRSRTSRRPSRPSRCRSRPRRAPSCRASAPAARAQAPRKKIDDE